MAPASSEASVGELLGNLARDTGVLVRQELQLAAAEFKSKLQTVAQNSVLIAIGAGLSLLGVMALMLAAIFALQMVLPLWAAAVVVGALFVVPGIILLVMGVTAITRLTALPKRTIATLKEDLGELKGALR